jgi:hypothetical protein
MTTLLKLLYVSDIGHVFITDVLHPVQLQVYVYWFVLRDLIYFCRDLITCWCIMGVKETSLSDIAQNNN